MIAEKKIAINSLIAEREEEENSTFKEKIYNNFRTISILIQRRLCWF